MIREPSLTVYVDGIETWNGTSVRVGMGTTADNRRVLFCGDNRLMTDLEYQLRNGGTVTASVPRFAILSATNPRDAVADLIDEAQGILRAAAGQGMAEYGLILSLVAMVAIVALLFLGGSVDGLLSTVGNKL